MKNIFTLLVVSLCFGALVAQPVNHLKYQMITLESGRKAVKPGLAKEYEVFINGEIIRVISKDYNGEKILKENEILFDLSKGLGTNIYKNYTYQIDSFRNTGEADTELWPTGEVKTIRGFNCEKYRIKKVKVGGYADTYKDNYTFWITKDFQLPKEVNRIITGGFTFMFSPEFEGALVQVDIEMNDPKNEIRVDMGIKKKEYTELDLQQFEMPWEREGSKYKAVIDDPYYRDKTSSPELKERFRRQKLILSQITGQENPDFSIQH